MINKTINIINNINITTKHKKKKIQCKYIHPIILKKLYQLNLIKGFYKNKNIYEINLNDNNNPQIFIKIYFKSNSKINFTYNQIVKNKIHLFSTIYILSTPYGYLTQYEAYNKHSGGFLIAKIIIK